MSVPMYVRIVYVNVRACMHGMAVFVNVPVRAYDIYMCVFVFANALHPVCSATITKRAYSNWISLE